MKNSFLEQNLQCLSLSQPDLARRITSLHPSGLIEVTTADSGEPSAVFRLPDGSRKRLHSRRDPRRDASLWAQGIHCETFQSIALMGLGLGYPLEEYLRVHDAKTKSLWCYESSLEVFQQMLSWKDWTPILQNPKVRFFVGVDESGLRRLASDGFQVVIVDGITIQEYTPSVQCDPDWYTERKKNLRDLIRQWTSELITVMENGVLFQTNTLRNFSHLSSSYLFRDVGGVLRGRPAIMVSAGPSLNKNASQLAAAKGKIPIISVDTSLRILQRHGVVPDLAVSIDALAVSVRHFEGVEALDRIPLVYDLEVAPGVVDNYPGLKFLVGTTKPRFYSWLEEVTGPLEGLTKGLTVAQAAFLLLARHGANPIILVGQDLSFEREGGKTHADGAAFQGRFQPGEGGQGKWEDPLKPAGLKDVPILWVPANDGGEVPTTHTLFAYLKRFEDDIATTGVTAINATEGGAFIKGSKVATLQEAFLTVGLETLPPFEGFAREAGFQTMEAQYGKQLEAMRLEMLAFFEKTRAACDLGIQRSSRLLKDLGWKHPSLEEILRGLGEIQESFGVIRSSDRIQMLIDRGVMRSLYGLHKSGLPDEGEHPEEYGKESAARYQAFFQEALVMVDLAKKILATS
jgi:hypothetical protein